MNTIKYGATLPYSAAQVFELVCNIQQYPEFINWCTSTTVHNRTPYKITATVYGHKLGVHFGVSIVYTLQVNRLIEIYLSPKPFRSIKGLWRFEAVSENSTRLNFELEFEFINRLLGWTLTPIIRTEVKNLITAFEERAKQLYS